jgi:hypothetical protein
VDYDTGEELHKRSELLFDLYHKLLGLEPRTADHRPLPQSTLTSAERARWPTYSGTYLGASYNSSQGLAKVYVAENQLVLEVDDEKRPLVPIAAYQYYYLTDSGERESLAFLPDDVQAQLLMVFGQAYRRFTVDDSYAPNPNLWTAYEGIYHDPSNPDPHTRYQIRMQDGKLLARTRGRETHLTPLSDTLFLSTFGLLEFLVVDDGSIPTLIVQGATPYHRN